MAATTQGIAAGPGSIPELDFRIEDAAPLAYAAVPTIVFRLRVESGLGHAVRSVLLDTQIQIAARRRPYDEPAQEALADIFGTPDRWGQTLHTLPWMRTTRVVPAFEESTVIDLPVVCTYDLDVTAARYFAALGNGEIPLEFLFSGTVFYSGMRGMLQTSRISWEKDADYDLPVSVWRETMDKSFPGSAWVRVSRETFEQLTAQRTRAGAAGWDETLDPLLRQAGADGAGGAVAPGGEAG